MKYYNHCHLFPDGAWPNDPALGSLAELQAFMADENIDKVVAFAPFWGPRTDDIIGVGNGNQWLLATIGGLPDIEGALAINPSSPQACEELDRYRDAGFVGIKTHPAAMKFRIDDPACDDFYALAAEHNLFVLFHTGTHGWVLDDYRPLRIDTILHRHPKLKVVIEHMGTSASLGRGFFDEALAVVSNHGNGWSGKSNAFVGLTGVAKAQHRELLQLAIQEAGAERCVFGLDWPHLKGNTAAHDRYQSELAVVDSLKLTDRQKELIFGEALRRLIELEL